MSISHVQVISVPVSDQDRAKDFYVDTLGLALLADPQFTPEMRWVMVSPPSGATLTLVTWFPTMPPGSLKGLVLESDELDSDRVALGAKGVAVSEVQSAPWGLFVTFDDPDGNGIVLQASAPNAPQADVSDWRNGNEHRDGQRRQSRLEAGCGSSRLGRARTSGQLRGRTTPRSDPECGGFHT